MTHASNITTSLRLQHVMSCLRTGPKTTAQLSAACRDMAIHSTVSEIRANGVLVDCRLVRVDPDTRRKVYEYSLGGEA